MPEDKVKEEQKAARLGSCGALNKHYTGVNVMKCTLEKNHEGDHSAPYPEDGADPNVLAFFSDAASVPLDASTEAKLKVQREKKKKAEAVR